MSSGGIGLGEWQVSADPDEALVAYGLGSCVAVLLYDPRRIAGMVHVVLPDSHGDHRGEPGKYADTALPCLLDALCEAGSLPRRMRAVICGGASMFTLAKLPDIGAANQTAVRAALRRYGIPLVAEDVGGNRGRTVRAEVGTGRVVVSAVGRGSVELWAVPDSAGRVCR